MGGPRVAAPGSCIDCSPRDFRDEVSKSSDALRRMGRLALSGRDRDPGDSSYLDHADRDQADHHESSPARLGLVRGNPLDAPIRGKPAGADPARAWPPHGAAGNLDGESVEPPERLSRAGTPAHRPVAARGAVPEPSAGP